VGGRNLGQLEAVNLRQVWTNEATGFTPWLAEEANLKLLGDAIGADLVLEKQEQNVGPFRADILCKDMASEQWVLIENQIERTDHVHLGQIITYAAGLHAVTIVWVASRFTDEHRAALDWLNEITEDRISFFGLEVELWRIGDSLPAPKFNMVSKPNEFVKGVTAARNQPSKGNEKYIPYWQAFKECAEEHSKVLRPMKPLPQYWTNISIGRTGFLLRAMAGMRDRYIMVDLVMLTDPDKEQIRALQVHRDRIDGKIPGLIWNEKPGKKESAIEIRKQGEDPNDEAKWPDQHRWMVENLDIMHRLFAPLIRELPGGK